METDLKDQLSALSGRFMGVAYKMTRNRQDAEDLLQESLLKAVLHENKFRADTNLNAWFYTIMKNTFINNYVRKNSKRSEMRTDNIAAISDARSSDTRTPYTMLLYKEMLAVIDRLDNDFKSTFQLHLHGLKYEEIAATLAIPTGTVKSRIFHARRKLSMMLNEK
jgi:RNA polymerase sigma factor (sigma-70 family)